jgi:hypothetical protein
VQICQDVFKKESMTVYQLEELIAVAAENAPVSNEVCWPDEDTQGALLGELAARRRWSWQYGRRMILYVSSSKTCFR